ncbi:hypothetical protein [Streptomyces sp. AA4]|uniref:hypothetical protein n=1 Tax=Streptomyces sp. AA4 TaxID=591158 RepID=UPI0025713131|nr:hypothetical protein [Streptomyces sp. AA4]
MPKPWDLEEFAARLASYRGRPMELLPLPLPVKAPDAVWLPGPTVDLIIYDASAADLLREHIILHELGHMILCHRGSADQPFNPNLLRTVGMERVEGEDPSVPLFRLTHPDVLRALRMDGAGDDDLVQVSLYRAGYSDPQERDAELAAHIIWHRAGMRLVPEGPRELDGEAADAVDRMDDVMGRVRG